MDRDLTSIDPRYFVTWTGRPLYPDCVGQLMIEKAVIATGVNQSQYVDPAMGAYERDWDQGTINRMACEGILCAAPRKPIVREF